MGRLSVYVNTGGRTAEAFTFYQSVFGGEFRALLRVRDLRAKPAPPAGIDDYDDVLVAHVEYPVPLTGGVLFGTDTPELLGYPADCGLSPTLNVESDNRVESERVFGLLAQGAQDVIPITSPYWGAFRGSVLDRFGVRWTFTNFVESEQHLTYTSFDD